MNLERQPELSLEEREARRRKNEIRAIIAVGAVLGVLFLLETVFFDFRGALGYSNLLFFSLININVILACVLLFLILRNVTKLLFERRRKVLGARLRTRLVVAFVSFALVPTALLFYVAMTFITNSIERWFSLQIESSLDQSLKVAQTYYETFENMAIVNASNLAQAISRDATPPETPAKPNKKNKKPALAPAVPPLRLEAKEIQTLIDQQCAQLGLDVIEVYLAPDRPPITATSQRAPKVTWIEEDRDFVKAGFANNPQGKVLTLGEKELIRGIAPLTDKQGQIKAAVVVSYFVPRSLVRKMKQIQTTYEQYRQLRVLENPIRSNYLIILGLIYIFIFFSATWFGFYLARQITEPLQDLADGARRVAAGETGVQIAHVSDDEMGTLVDVFNRMWADLGASRSALENALRDLEQTNVELERRRASMEAVLSNVAAGVLAFDNDGHVLTINPSAERILGVRQEEALNHSWNDVFPRELTQSFAGLADQLRTGHGHTVTRQMEIQVANERRTVLAILSVIRDQQGAASGAVLVVDDLTELLKAQRMAAWQEMARQIAHEIKNPLTPIQLAAQRLSKRYEDRFDPEKDKVFFECTGTIVRQVDELKGMVKEFSDFARIAEAKPALTDLSEIIREVLVLYGEAHKRIKFQSKIGPNVPQLLLDREQIKRALINVLDNAVASISGAGEVQIGAWLTDQGRFVRLEVADSGQGLPREYRSRLFEPYFSTKKMGTGLGLAIVHRIVKDHGGGIRLLDNKPKGTIVAIDLPVPPA